ncbi:MAG: AraC family transcriptional regulator [Calditrichaeota bacterium]|nr:MAG: AraC family transcriptional regulator [Calditrichota bacterium]
MATASVSLINSILFAAAKRGIEKNVLLDLIDLDEATIQNPQNRVACEKPGKLLRLVTELLDDPYFPLYYGQQFQPSNFYILGYLISNSPTVREAYKRTEKFARLVGDGMRFELIEGESKSRIRIELVDEKMKIDRQYCLVGCVTQQVTAIRYFVSKQKISPLAIYFAHDFAGEIDEFEKQLGCKVYFGAENYEIVYDNVTLDQPITHANPELYPLLEKYAEAILENVSESQSISHQVSKEIMQLIPGNQASLENVAANLSLGVRTLQRQLKDENNSFNALLKKVRKEMAIDHLKKGQLTIAEISYLVGFSEPSVFHRSFKNWTGFTPKNFRKNNFATA